MFITCTQEGWGTPHNSYRRRRRDALHFYAANSCHDFALLLLHVASSFDVTRGCTFAQKHTAKSCHYLASDARPHQTPAWARAHAYPPTRRPIYLVSIDYIKSLYPILMSLILNPQMSIAFAQ